MWKPDQSLDDFVGGPAPEVTSKPPRSISLRGTGEIEVLKPLIRPEVRAEPARIAFKASRPLQPLWFRRFLAVGSGALVMIAMVLVSAIFVGISDPGAGPDLATNWKPDDKFVQPEEPFSFDPSSPWNFELATGGVDVVRSSTRRRVTRPRTYLAANRSKHEIRPLPQPEQPKFVPTTLVIYAENGVINTRVEPWLQADDKKTTTFNN